MFENGAKEQKSPYEAMRDGTVKILHARLQESEELYAQSAPIPEDDPSLVKFRDDIVKVGQLLMRLSRLRSEEWLGYSEEVSQLTQVLIQHMSEIRQKLGFEQADSSKITILHDKTKESSE